MKVTVTQIPVELPRPDYRVEIILSEVEAREHVHEGKLSGYHLAINKRVYEQLVAAGVIA